MACIWYMYKGGRVRYWVGVYIICYTCMLYIVYDMTCIREGDREWWGERKGKGAV